jgi:serine protease Do
VLARSIKGRENLNIRQILISRRNLGSVLTGTIAAVAVAIPLTSAQALTAEQIDAVASQTTVVIAQGLQKGDIEARQEWNPGSGAIVAHQGNTYYVLTALHVVRTRDVVYGVRTSDGEVHLVDDVNTKENIHWLGEEEGQFGDLIDGLDLAIIEFDSDMNYPVAVIGDSRELQPGDTLYVSGWPNPDDDSARRVRKTVEGKLAAIFWQPSADGGYSLLYNNLTQRGMSGGPVFNARGELVGIHGRGKAQRDHYCIDPQLSTDNSCGMQTLHFQGTLDTLGLPYDDPPVDPKVIEAGLRNQENADVIEDIYETFTFDMRSLLRDTPSGGCGSLLLGDDC